ncbi:MAG: hypothetical protein ACI86C_001793 [Candidatus Latescibacterota bacterium]|jgi:uncharacterized protein (TIGR01777 family)
MTILIAGATGLIGREIVRQFKESGVHVNYLTTSKEKIEKSATYNGFYWNPATAEIDKEAFTDVSAIINLAGATIAKRWTPKYKRTILDSRTQSAEVLFNALQSTPHKVNQYISASGISIYPNSKSKLYSEESLEIDTSFLAEVVVAWELSADAFRGLGIEVAKVRTGVVLATDDGALREMLKPIKIGLGSVLGDGEQWLSWIHIEDIARMYLFVLDQHLEGVYNAVAPSPVTNKKITKTITAILGKSLWLPSAPAFMIRMVLGEMSTLLLEGQLVCPKKMEAHGFKFHYTNIESALRHLMR